MRSSSLFDVIDPVPSPSLQLFAPVMEDWANSDGQSPDQNGSKTRITNPGLTQPSTLDVLNELKKADEVDVPRVDEEQRQHYRTNATLGEFYWSVIHPWRLRQLGRGEVARGTLTNERQSIRCYQGFDKSSRPEKWPLGIPWNGRPMGFIATNYIGDWIKHRLTHGNERGPLAQGSMPKRWNHLRFVLNQAFRLRIIDEQISLSVKELVQQCTAELDVDLLDDLDMIPNAWTDEQLHAIYRQLDGDLEMQTAWVLGAQAGPRTADLFGLRWQKNIRLNAQQPELLFIPQKTKRKQRLIWVPLGPIAVDHLNRLAHQQAHLGDPQGLVFARLTDGQRDDPEDGERSRARIRRIKSAIVDAGIELTEDMERPFQMLRATCNSRLNQISTTMGDRATHGKRATVQGRSYDDYRDALTDAVMKLDARRQAAGIFSR